MPDYFMCAPESSSCSMRGCRNGCTDSSASCWYSCCSATRCCSAAAICSATNGRLPRPCWAAEPVPGRFGADSTSTAATNCTAWHSRGEADVGTNRGCRADTLQRTTLPWYLFEPNLHAHMKMHAQGCWCLWVHDDSCWCSMPAQTAADVLCACTSRCGTSKHRHMRSMA